MFRAGFRFEEFELDSANCELRRRGHHVRLERIPMQLLSLLLENAGGLVRRDAIIERLWGNDVFVEAEHSINTAVNKLRAILRDDPRNPRFIRTVVGQGYRFIARVDALESYPISPVENAATGDQEIVAADPDATPRSGYDVVAPDHALAASSSPELPPTKGSHPFRLRPWMVAGLAASLVLFIAVYLLLRQPPPAHSAPRSGSLQSIAVLPFRNLAQTSEQNYLVDGITDELTTNLARSTSLRVISQRSAMQYRSPQIPVQQIAKELNVDTIVEGSYLQAGKQVRITAQLLDARNDQHLWAQTYTDSGKDLLAMQDEVTADITQQISMVLRSQFTRTKPRTTNARARDAFLRGRFFWNKRTPSAIGQSVKCYTEAIREDSGYADAYAALAEAYVLLAVYDGADPSDYLLKGQFAAERALDLDGTLGEAHVALGAIKVERDWDWEGAEREYRLGLQLTPADPTAHHWYSLHLARMGKPEQAEVEIQRAIALDPLSLMIRTDAAVIA